MPKLAAHRVTWDPQARAYQVSEKTGSHTTSWLMHGESQQWSDWLSTVSSFAFESRDGHRFTARKETRTGEHLYWIAYQRVGKRLARKYVGLPNQMTLPRLEEVARVLSSQDQPMSVPSAGQTASQKVDQGKYVLSPCEIPPVSQTLVPRPRLIAQLNEGWKHALTLVSAPAGFGKTALLATWIRTLPLAIQMWLGSVLKQGIMIPRPCGRPCSWN